MFDPRRISVTEASTKSGKTASGIIWLFEQALAGRPGWNYWWVAPTSLQARIAFNRMRQHVQLNGRPFFAINMTDQLLVLPQGQVIAFRSGDHPDALYGEDVYACVIDEASRFKKDAWFAIRSTLTATRGPLRIIGNVKGKNNWFYELARRAEEGKHPELGYHRLTAYDAIQAGVLKDDEIAEARRTLPGHVFKELYLAEAAAEGAGMFPTGRMSAWPFYDGKAIRASVRFWDKAGSEGEYAAYTAGALLHMLYDGRFVIGHMARGHWSALEREKHIKEWPQHDRQMLGFASSYEVGVEQEPGSGGKESAEATIRNLAGFRVFADKVTGSKEVRAEPFAAQVQGGNVMYRAG